MTTNAPGDEIVPALSGKPQVLIIEDDVDLNNLLKYTLEMTQDYIVHSAFEGGNAISLIQEMKPDLVILDVMLPGMYGTEVLKRIRGMADLRHIPVILLTARSQERDKIEGFEAGADDYITKPFSPKELLLRAQALLRRARQRAVPVVAATATEVPNSVIQVGVVKIFSNEYRVTVFGEQICLTATEFQLLLFLAERSGRLQSRETLLQKVWGYEGNVNTRTVDTHIKRLRQKLGDAGGLIETVHGFGYQLVAVPRHQRENGSNSNFTTLPVSSGH